ncbi:MAG: hypothetical protein WKG06_45245 [Segetibacter sp.]
MDEKDFVFINKPFMKQEEKEFSEFLKTKKSKAKLKDSQKRIERNIKLA